MVRIPGVPQDSPIVAGEGGPKTDGARETVLQVEAVDAETPEPGQRDVSRTGQAGFGDLQQNLTAWRQVLQR